jgi:putative NIF3 family GTP cyclohydrolase 1 type 2
MVEIPYRLQRAGELKQLAGHVLAEYPRESADRGAALAVICYRALEAHASDGQLVQLDTQIADYLALASSNPHIRRWQVSLTYVRARLRLRRGNRSGALADFVAVAEAEVAHITPTLGTKTIDAAFWAGTLSWLGGDKAGGRGWWRHGLQAAGPLVGSAWPEFIGNREAPFVFAMKDAAEIIDRATACAEALALTHRTDSMCEAALDEIGRTSLRSALRRLEADIVAARADVVALGEEFHRVCNELAAQGAQKADLEHAATERLARIHQLEAQLSNTQSAFVDTKKTAHARLDKIMALETRIRTTDVALDEARSLSMRRLQEGSLLSVRLDQAHRALDETKALSVHRLKHIQALEVRLGDTDAALNEVKAQAVLRLTEKMGLEERIMQTDAALEEAKRLAVSRLNRIVALEQELRVAQTAADELTPAVTVNPSPTHNVDTNSAR